MNPQAGQAPDVNKLLVFALLIIVGVLLVACGRTLDAEPLATPTDAVGTASPDISTSTPVPGITSIPTSVPTSTSGPTATPTLDLLKHYWGWPPSELAYDPTVQADATHASQRVDAYHTATALTPSATIANVPLETVEPWPTPAVGRIKDMGCYPRVHRGEAQFDSCWYTQVNGAWFLVGAGFEGFTPDDIHGAKADEVNWRGLIWVSNDPYGAPLSNQLYPAPRPDLHIIAVDGPRITLASRDPTVPDIFVFDLATRQWVTPGPTPVPSLPPSPGP